MKNQLLIILLFCIFTSCKPTREMARTFEPSFRISNNTTHKIPEGQVYTFGYLKVLENRQKLDGRTIELPVYIFKSRSKNPKKDPIIYTVGGPGASTMPSAPYMKFYRYLDDRDFILIEQRGTYYAKPHLDCPEWAEIVYQSRLPDFDTQQSDALFAAAAKDCRNRLTKQGINLDSYTTNEIAADIHDLVTVLDLQEYNLLTISYSTKIAQVLLRDYPERIRSVVMDSPLPLEVDYDEESVANLLASVDLLLSDCEADKTCKQAFPNIKDRFWAYLEEKSAAPLVVTIDHPSKGRQETFRLRGADLITVFTAASTSDVLDVPFEINKLLNNDLTTVKARLENLFRGPGNGAGMGMRLSVWCAEEFPFNNQQVITDESSKYPVVTGLSPAVFSEEVCNIWRVKKVSPLENQAVISDVPVLLLSGEYDNETPAKWAQAMRENLINSHHVIFRAWKHTLTTNWGNPCAMQVANDFFNRPGVRPNPDCLDAIKDPVFKTE